MIALAADHGGFALKEQVKQWLEEQKIPYHDFGTLDGASCDYPDMAAAACDAVVSGACEKALLFCGAKAYKANSIETVKEVQEDLKKLL